MKNISNGALDTWSLCDGKYLTRSNVFSEARLSAWFPMADIKLKVGFTDFQLVPLVLVWKEHVYERL